MVVDIKSTVLTYKCLYTLLFFGYTVLSYAQTPWVENKGSLYISLNTSNISYEDIFDGNGEGVESSFETKDRTFSLFAQYSLADSLTIVVDLPYKLVNVDGNSLSAFGDLKFQVKRELMHGFPLTAFVGYIAPTGTREGALRTGYMQHSFDGGLSTGFARGSNYAYFGAGYRYRNNIPNQFILDAEFGTKAYLGDRCLYLSFHIDGALNLDDIEDPEGDQSALYHNNGEFLSPGIKLGLYLSDHLWLNFGANGAIIAKNLASSPALSLGISWKLRKKEDGTIIEPK